jgi:hypothetical protein
VATTAGITYVDVWDGFVDEAGQFLQKGPDFEGQTRQLRSSDGVYFTKAGARTRDSLCTRWKAYPSVWVGYRERLGPDIALA